MNASCPRCEGTGQCVECKGTGRVTCPNCQGRGECVTPRGKTFPCKACTGTGKIDCATACSSCEGRGVITEELQNKIQQKYTLRFSKFTPLSRVSTWLVGLNALLFVVFTYTPAQTLMPDLWNNAAMFRDHQYWKLVTPIFLHFGLWHVGLNCWFLYNYCPQLEGIYGMRRFLLLYLIAGVVGNLVSWGGHTLVSGPMNYASVGASTALFGVGTAFLGLHWRWGFFSAGEIQRWGIYLGLYLLAGFAASAGLPIPYLGQVDNWGHLGGAVGGLLYVYLSPRPTGH